MVEKDLITDIITQEKLAKSIILDAQNKAKEIKIECDKNKTAKIEEVRTAEGKKTKELSDSCSQKIESKKKEIDDLVDSKINVPLTKEEENKIHILAEKCMTVVLGSKV